MPTIPSRARLARRCTALAAVAALTACSIGTDDATPSTTLPDTQPVVVEGAALVAAPTTIIPADADPSVGTAIPTIRGQSFDGTPVVIQPGAPQLVVVSSHWAPHGRIALDDLARWIDDGTIPDTVDVVAIATDPDRTRENYPPVEWFASTKWPATVMADDTSNTARDALGVTTYPITIAVDAGGVVRGRLAGEPSEAQITQLVGAALGETG